MKPLVSVIVVLIILAIIYIAYSAMKKKTPAGGNGGKGKLSTPAPSTWAGDWISQNAANLIKTQKLPLAQCLEGCLDDPKCKTVTGFAASASTADRACAYYSTAVPPTAIHTAGPGWQGTIAYRVE